VEAAGTRVPLAKPALLVVQILAVAVTGNEMVVRAAESTQNVIIILLAVSVGVALAQAS